MTQPVCIIPARWASTRFPGKPLAPIVGATGISRPLIERTFDVAVHAQCFRDIWVATDDDRIYAHCSEHDIPVVLTKQSCRNGTERVAQATEILGFLDRQVINLQGDSVLTPPAWLSYLAEDMAEHPLNDVTTLVYPRRADEAPDPGDVEALVNVLANAMYFTRGPIPKSEHGRLQHFGIYGYRRGLLQDYVELDPTPREEAESLEQLRFLENQYSVRCIVPIGPGGIAPEREVNYPNDVAAVEEVLKQWNIE